jgi:hypothetical protein
MAMMLARANASALDASRIPEMIGESVTCPHGGEAQWQSQQRVAQPVERFIQRQREERCWSGVENLLQSDDWKDDEGGYGERIVSDSRLCPGAPNYRLHVFSSRPVHLSPTSANSLSALPGR